jgi:16S rRNA (cytosine1402-N4)-methyltransferase
MKMERNMTAHESVLLHESLQALNIRPDGIYIDGTFGRGGHSLAIMQQLDHRGQLVAIDKDLQAVEFGRKTFASYSNFQLIHGSFSAIYSIAQQLNLVGKINGILLDLGVSSPQLDESERGFSFMNNGPLDMRMNQTQDLSAADFINEAEAAEMATVFRNYGEEKFANRIAQAIVREREKERITTTEALAEIVKAANPKWEKHKHPATRVFQAVRIHINQELDDLKHCLADSLQVLTQGGRLAVISFHSLEDRIVKQFMRDQEEGERLPREIPVKYTDQPKSFSRIGKAIKPTENEVKNNARARSAVLRIGEKLA